MPELERTPWRVVARFRVFGEPKGQPRPRAFATRIGGKVTARVFEAGTAEGWKSAVALASEPQRPSSPLEGPIRVDLELLLHRPKALMRKRHPEGRIYATRKPDRDNCDKAVMDCLTTLGWWRDDAQVVAGEITKQYHAKDEAAGAIVTISVLGDEL